jgi:hypothetical protein
MLSDRRQHFLPEALEVFSKWNFELQAHRYASNTTFRCPSASSYLSQSVSFSDTSFKKIRNVILRTLIPMACQQIHSHPISSFFFASANGHVYRGASVKNN